MQNSPREIIIVDATQLTVHPVAKLLPELAEDDPSFIALVDDMRQNGQLQPVDIDKTNQILDGRHRWRACKRLKFPEISAVVRPDEEAVPTIMSSLLLRRHYGKSALAYCAYPALRAAYELGRSKGGGHSVAHPFTIEDQAEKLGISKSLYKYAGQLHKIFAEDPDYKDAMLPKILDGKTSLGEAIAGYAGRKSTKGKARPEDDKLKLFNRVFEDEINRLEYWEKFSTDAQAEHWKLVRSKITDLNSTLRQSLFDYHRRMIKELMKAAKEES